MVNTQLVARRLADMAWHFDDDAFAAALNAAGWALVRSAEPRRTWQLDDIVLDTISSDGSVFLAEVDLDVRWLEDEIDEADNDWAYQPIEDAFRTRYEQHLAEATAVLGPPAFEGRSDRLARSDLGGRGIDPDSCSQLALWPIPDASLMLVRDWQEKETPLVVALRVQPFDR